MTPFGIWLDAVSSVMQIGMASGYCSHCKRFYSYPVKGSYTHGCPDCTIPLLQGMAEGRVPTDYQGGVANMPIDRLIDLRKKVAKQLDAIDENIYNRTDRRYDI